MVYVLLSFCIGGKVAVVCERNKSTISCKTGHTISIVQANYGRYDSIMFLIPYLVIINYHTL